MKNKILPMILGFASFCIAASPIHLGNYESNSNVNRNISIKKIKNSGTRYADQVSYNGSSFNVSNLGHGFIPASGDFNAYNVDLKTKIDSNIFNKDWLREQYKDIVFDGDNYTKSMNGFGTTVEQITSTIIVGYEEMTELTAGYAGIEGSVGLGFEQDFGFSTTQIVSNYFTKSILKTKLTSCALPNATNYSLYSEHLDNGYLIAVDQYFNGDITPEEFFSDYGTHILSSASYGGIYEFNSKTTSSEFAFESTITNRMKESFGVSLSYAGATVGIKETLTQSLSTSKGVSSNSLTFESKGHIYGGDTAISSDVLDDMLRFKKEASLKWLTSVKDKPIMLEYQIAHPIYKYLPKGTTQEQVKKMKNDMESYIAKVKLGFNFDYSYSGKETTISHDFSECVFGNYWNNRDSVTKTYSFKLTGPNPDINPRTFALFEKAGVTRVEYAFSCVFSPDNGNDHNPEVTVELDNGDKKNTVLNKENYEKIGKNKNVLLKGNLDFNKSEECLITQMTTINIHFKELTPGKFWGWNEPFVKASYINLSFRFIID